LTQNFRLISTPIELNRDVNLERISRIKRVTSVEFRFEETIYKQRYSQIYEINVFDLPDTWKKPFLVWWFLLALSTTDLQTSTCGRRCKLGMWCHNDVGRRGSYICASPDGAYNTPTQRPSAQGRCLSSCSGATVRKAKIRIEKSGRCDLGRSRSEGTRTTIITKWTKR